MHHNGSAYPITGILEVQYIVETVFIPKETFLMSSSDTEPNRSNTETQHEVTFTKDYYMSKYEITNTQYAAFLNDVEVDDTGKKADIQSGQTLIQASGSYDWGLHHNGGRWER
jgi:formylglycine-generating enzyme required for sulfatase activity